MTYPIALHQIVSDLLGVDNCSLLSINDSFVAGVKFELRWKKNDEAYLFSKTITMEDLINATSGKVIWDIEYWTGSIFCEALKKHLVEIGYDIHNVSTAS